MYQQGGDGSQGGCCQQNGGDSGYSIDKAQDCGQLDISATDAGAAFCKKGGAQKNKETGCRTCQIIKKEQVQQGPADGRPCMYERGWYRCQAKKGECPVRHPSLKQVVYGESSDAAQDQTLIYPQNRIIHGSYTSHQIRSDGWKCSHSS